MTDIQKVEEWVEKLAEEAFQSEEKIKTIPKFPVQLTPVDARTFDLVFDHMFRFERTKDEALKEIQKLITVFVINQIPKDKSIESYWDFTPIVNETLGLFNVITEICIIVSCKIKFKSIPEANLIKDSNPSVKVKKVVKPAVVKSEDNNYKIFMYAKSNGQSKAAEKFNMSVEEVKTICAAQRSLKK